MAGFEIGRRETLLSERKIRGDEPDESQGRHRFETPKPLTIYEVRLTRLLRGAGARRFGVYCGDRGIGYSNADPHPGPLPSDAGLYPYLFGWTPSPAQNAQKIEWKTWSSMLSPTRGSNATNDRQRKIGRILDVFRRNDGVQPKRYGTRPASDGRGPGGAGAWVRVAAAYPESPQKRLFIIEALKNLRFLCSLLLLLS